jgi:predicted ATP-grasp superfamily ATP-dependent carboligase
LAWLLEFGSRSPGMVLYPTSDELAWIISAHRDELTRWYQVYSPPLDALTSVLDKRQLSAAARRAGLCVPDSWCPATESELLEVADSAPFPLYMKPRVQFAGVRMKVARIAKKEHLVKAWRAWRSHAGYPAVIARHVPGIDLPLLQSCYGGERRIFTVDGFIDRSGRLAATLGCVKILQLPRGSGAGICFEAAEVPLQLQQRLLRLFIDVGFHGVFDAEFIEHDGSHLLIDVNPRFYNHMVFEITRGLPLAWLAYLAAIDDTPRLAEAIRESRSSGVGSKAYVNSLHLQFMLAAQGLSGGMTHEERRHWRGWRTHLNGGMIEATRDADDPRPAIAELATELTHLIKHPRAYLRALTDRGPRNLS